MKCNPLVSEPKQLSVSITNEGTQAKVFNILKGSTGVEEVIGNTEIVSFYEQAQITTVASSTPSVLPIIAGGKAFFVNTFPQVMLAINESDSTLEEIPIFGQAFGNDTQLFTLNNFVYSFGGGPRVVSVFSITPLAYITTKNISGVGSVGYGDVDAERSRVYMPVDLTRTIEIMDVPANTFAATIDLSAYAGPLECCCLGDTYLVSTVGTNVVVVDPDTLLVVVAFPVLTSTGFIKFVNGVFVISDNGFVHFLDESSLLINTIACDISPVLFTKNIRDNRYVFISNQASNGYIMIDSQNQTFSEIIAGFGLSAVIASYNPLVDRLIVTDTANFTITSIDPSTLEVETISFLANITSGASSLSTGRTYFQPGAGNTALVTDFTQDPAVVVIYNGGETTTDFIDRSTSSMPMKILKMKIVSSSKEELLNILSKVKKDSSGPLKSFPIQNSVYFDANSEQFVVDIIGENLEDPIFDGNTYLSGTINAMSNLSFEVEYVEYDQSRPLYGECIEEELPVKKKRVCIFYNRKLF